MSPFVDLKFLPAIVKHFGHKNHALEPTFGIEGGEDLLFAANLHPVANAQLPFSLHTFRSL
jgi:hypothetical protein